jgi:DNA-binding Lrp family transcriptional regulator
MVTLGRSPDSRQKSRAFLQAIYDNDGRADTTTVRRATGLSRGEIKYRYEMLVDNGLITIEYNPTLSAAGESPVKVGILTQLAYDEINKGLLQGGQYQPDRGLPADEVAAELVETQDYISTKLFPLIKRVRDLETQVAELNGTE